MSESFNGVTGMTGVTGVTGVTGMTSVTGVTVDVAKVKFNTVLTMRFLES